MNPRGLLLDLYDAALRAVDGRAAVITALEDFRHGPVALFAIGKAASAMTRGAHAALNALGTDIRRTLLITKVGHVDPEAARLPHVRIIESAHPVPDARSIAAGHELEQALAALTPDEYPLFLVSGGSSSVVELLQRGVTLDQLRALNERGLASGWDIGRLNNERARLSRLKRGGVARLLNGRAAHALFISDVPGDDPDVIGSGLLGRAPGLEDRITRVIIAGIDGAAKAAAEAAVARGFECQARGERFAGDAATVAQEFVAALRGAAADVLVWGGESTVTLPAQTGRGGRNTHLALAAARALRANEPFTILAAGTDGTDGPTEDAGAVVDARTVERAELAGVDVERAWQMFDSGSSLEAAGDLVHTGPTGTNVGDILIGIKHDARRHRDPAAPRVL